MLLTSSNLQYKCVLWEGNCITFVVHKTTEFHWFIPYNGKDLP